STLFRSIAADHRIAVSVSARFAPLRSVNHQVHLGRAARYTNAIDAAAKAQGLTPGAGRKYLRHLMRGPPDLHLRVRSARRDRTMSIWMTVSRRMRIYPLRRVSPESSPPRQYTESRQQP